MSGTENGKIDEILTINGYFESKFKEKGSLFNGQAYPGNTPGQCREILEQVRKKYYDATHNCFAYRLSGGEYKYSDDGEPNGTAGIRILNAIDHFKLTNLIVVVTRYFGGTKLGVGPLGKAYYTSAESVLEKAEKIKKAAYLKVLIKAGFSFSGLLHRIFSDYEMKIIDSSYKEDVSFICLIKPGLFNNMSEILLEKTGGNVEIKSENSINYY